MSFLTFVFKRNFSFSAVREGKRNFKKFSIFNKRGTRIFKRQQMENPDPDVPIHTRGVRDTGYYVDKKFVSVPEMIPEIIVPDLKDFQLKPYVSYKTPEVIQSEFTAHDLFNAVYARKITKDFNDGKLDEIGQSLAPSPEEQLTPEEAKIRDRKTGSDIF